MKNLFTTLAMCNTNNHPVDLGELSAEWKKRVPVEKAKAFGSGVAEFMTFFEMLVKFENPYEIGTAALHARAFEMLGMAHTRVAECFHQMPEVLAMPNGQEKLDSFNALTDAVSHAIKILTGEPTTWAQNRQFFGLSDEWYNNFKLENLTASLKDQVGVLLQTEGWAENAAREARGKLQDTRQALETLGVTVFTGDKWDHPLQGASALLGLSESVLEKSFDGIKQTINSCSQSPYKNTNPPRSKANQI
jgi:hypothetical protein